MDSKSAVIHILAEYTLKLVPDLLAADTAIFKEASQCNLPTIKEELKEKRQQLQYIEYTLQQYQPESPQDLLVKKALPFTNKARADIDTIMSNIESAQQALHKLHVMLYLDPQLSTIDSNPFTMIYQFYLDLQRAHMENKQRKAELEAKANREQRAALANTARLQSSRLKAMLETADDKDRNMVDGLLVALH